MKILFLMSFIDELEKKLVGGKFRMLNEKLYVGKSFTKEEARKYAKYYAEQIAKWPQNPRKVIADAIREDGVEMKIADLGCGDAELSSELPNVTSFDKYPVSEKVISADIESIPVEDEEFDGAVNCLSLMMTYASRATKEVNRILKIGGTWYIAEVQSRISSTKTLINSIEKFGFKLKKVDATSNTHFCLLVFTKVSNCTLTGRLPVVKFQPCLYKKR
ncbi:ribosomal RNA-processing protein 8 [Pancytospora epiphaga]|nr:ribosomal RNA-processing protein 8 [Pancytospora epiphaga]